MRGLELELGMAAITRVCPHHMVEHTMIPTHPRRRDPLGRRKPARGPLPDTGTDMACRRMCPQQLPVLLPLEEQRRMGITIISNIRKT